MSKFMNLSKAAALYKQSHLKVVGIKTQQVIKQKLSYNLNQGFSQIGNLEVNNDPTVIARFHGFALETPLMFSTEPGMFSFQARLISQFEEMEDYIDSDMDQLIMFYKIKYEKELDRILVDVKGNTLNEKLHRALDCDESTFKEIINKEI